MGPPNYCTEDRVRNLINEGIAAYETTVGAVRHAQNAAKLDKLTAALNRFLGGFAAISGLIILVELYLKLSTPSPH